MSKILCGILNWKRTAKDMKKGISKLPGDVVVCTDNPEFWKGCEILEAVESIAASKNKILQKAIDGNYEYCFIIEDDIILSRKEDLLKYVSTMKQYDLNLMLYGFGNTGLNRVLENKPNPCLIVNDGRGNELYVNRYPGSAMMAFRVKEDMRMFDESLIALETDYLVHDIASDGNYPFKGFFFDIAESWKVWRRVRDVERVRQKTLNDINKDRQQRGNITLDNNVDVVINYIKEHRD